MYKEDFKKYLKYIKLYSDKTVNSYEYDLIDYENFLKENNIDIKDDSDNTLKKYLLYISNKDLSAKSVGRHLSALRTYYDFLKKEGIINNNIFKGVKNPKVEKSIPSFIEHKKLVEILNSFLDSDLGIRDRMVVELLYATGLRVGELVNIKIKDIEFYNNSIKVLGKGSKERYVFYNDTTSDVLKKYLVVRKKLLKENHEYLLLNDKGGKISEAKVRLIIKNILIKCGIKSKITPHTFRHTFATDLLNGGADLVNVKELLGHSSLNTTSIYTHITNDRIKEVYKNTHPRA